VDREYSSGRSLAAGASKLQAGYSGVLDARLGCIQLADAQYRLTCCRKRDR
jgi:hypothetical protein